MFSSITQSKDITVTSLCETECIPSRTKLCSIVSDTNQVLGCNVGDYYQKTGTSTITKQICAPPRYGNYAQTASFCKVNTQKQKFYFYIKNILKNKLIFIVKKNRVSINGTKQMVIL